MYQGFQGVFRIFDAETFKLAIFGEVSHEFTELLGSLLSS